MDRSEREELRRRLDVAATHGNLAESVQGLLEEGTYAYANQVFLWSALRGHLDVVVELLESERVDPSVDDNCAICEAAENGHLSVVNRLLEDERVDPSVDGNRAIRQAARNGHLSVVNHLLEDNRVDPSFNNNYAIGFAAENGHLSVVNRLLEDKRVNPNWAVRDAAGVGHLAVVNRLLEDERVDPSFNNNCAIIGAARNGHLSVLNRLLEDERVDPSAQNNYALRRAAEYGRMDFIRQLVLDPRIYRASQFSDLPATATAYMLDLFESNSLPFDLASSLRHDDLYHNAKIRTTLETMHNLALDQISVLLQSGSLSTGLDDQDAQVHILWMGFGHVMFPFLPVEERWGRLSHFVSSANAAAGRRPNVEP